MNAGTDDATDYDRTTARDIAGLLHHLAELRYAPPSTDPAGRDAFLTREAELFTRIARGQSAPAPTPTAARSDRWPPTPRQPPDTNARNSHSCRWGQLRGEKPAPAHHRRGHFCLTRPSASSL
jgi:hypothetical protein